MTTTLDICICTYQRPGLLTEALSSLIGLRWPNDIRGGILIIDNDDTPSARSVVEQFATQGDLPVRYIHAPSQNISIARNAALVESEAALLAFLDDDEKATPGWIEALLKTMRQTYAEAVLGPVKSVYSADAPRWMQIAQPHATEPVFVKGEIQTGYTCNVLMDRRSPRLAGVRFDLAFGRSGGEDTAFFKDLTQAQGTIAYAPDAIVTEDVPAERARLAWLLRRRYRMGQTHGHLVANGQKTHQRIWSAALALSKMLYSTGTVFLFAINPPRRNTALMRAALHAGAVAGILGAQPITLYGSDGEIKEKRTA